MPGMGNERIDEPDDQVINCSPEIPCHRANGHPQYQRQGRGGKGDAEADPSSIQKPHKLIAAELVGSQPVGSAAGLPQHQRSGGRISSGAPPNVWNQIGLLEGIVDIGVVRPNSNAPSDSRSGQGQNRHDQQEADCSQCYLVPAKGTRSPLTSTYAASSEDRHCPAEPREPRRLLALPPCNQPRRVQASRTRGSTTP